MSEGQRTTGGADIQYEERIPPKIETRWCHEPVQVMNAHGKGLPSETNELDEIEPDNENLKDFFPQGIRTNEEVISIEKKNPFLLQAILLSRIEKVTVQIFKIFYIK